MTDPGERRRVVLVTGLSGAGKASALRALEDIGYEAVDNPPVGMIEAMVARGGGKLAIGVDARTRGFDSGEVLAALDRLRANMDLQPELIFVLANETTLLRRYTESRRRHPLAPQGLVADGIAAEQTLTARLRAAADLVVDTSDLPLADLRRRIERQFGAGSDSDARGLVVSLMSFAYPRGLPPDADLVFDARFLRNPHYDPILRPGTGLDPAVGAYIAEDPDFRFFFARLAELVEMLLPRFVQEGKKYTTVAVGCTGGRHRSVYLIQKLAERLATHREAGGESGLGWRLHVWHRELARDVQDHGMGAMPVRLQAREA
ncbi:MAG: RNase adapter RapZ [Rhodospirillales bacterium]